MKFKVIKQYLANINFDPEFILPLYEKSQKTGNRMDWMKSEANRASWSFYIKPEEAKNDKFKAKKALLTEQCRKVCLVENGVTHNISGEFQLKNQ